VRITHTAFQSPSRPGSRTVVMRRGRAVVPAVLALLAVGGCSDENGSADTSEEPVVTTKPASVPATDIAGRPLTTTTQPTAPNTSASVTMAASASPGTTSALASQSPEAAVRAAVGRAERTFLESMRDPDLDVDDGLAAIRAVTAPGSAARSSFESTYMARRGTSLTLVENEQVPFTMTTEGDVFMIAGDEALVQVCVIDSDVIVRNELSADGDEEQRVVGDEIVTARRSTQRFVLSDEGQWQLASSDVIAEYPGETACPHV